MPWSNTIAELLQQQGQQGAETARAIANIAANAKLQRGKIISGAVSDVGQALSSIPAQRQQAQASADQAQLRGLQMQELSGKLSEEQKARADEQKALEIFTKHGPDIDSAISELYTVNPEMADKAATHRLSALKEGASLRAENLKAQQAQDQRVASVIQRPQNQADWTKALQTLDDAKIPHEFSPDFEVGKTQVPAFVNSTKSAHDLTMEGIERDKAKSLDDYRNRPAPAVKPPAVGTPEDYITRTFGQNPTPAQVLQGRTDFRNATTRPPAASGAASSDKQDVADTIQGMKEGTIPPQLPSRASREYIALTAEAKRQGFDLSKANEDWVATQRYLSTLNGQQQVRLRQAVSFARESLPLVEDLATKPICHWQRMARMGSRRPASRPNWMPK